MYVHSWVNIIVSTPKFLSLCWNHCIFWYVCFYIPWHNVCYTYAKRFELSSQSVEESNQSIFWPRVWRPRTRTQFSSDTADSNNVTCFVLNHVIYNSFQMIVNSVNVDIEHWNVILKRIIIHIWAHRYPCVFNNNVDFLTLPRQISNYSLCDFPGCFILNDVHCNNHDFFRISTLAFYPL